MREIIERQSFVFSVDFAALVLLDTSQIESPINLRFAADELIFRSITYNVPGGTDTDDMVQIWCNITHDGLLTAFPIMVFMFNTPSSTSNSITHFKQVMSYFNFNKLGTLQHHFITFLNPE
jgi:hypothetical protein